MRQRLEDADPAVAAAALTVGVKLMETGIMSKERFRPILLKQLRDTWKACQTSDYVGLLIKIIRVLRDVKPCLKSLLLLAEILSQSANIKHAKVVIHQCFQAFSNSDTQTLLEAQDLSGTPFVASIRHLLVSQDINDVYLFVSCLNNVDCKLWAGTIPGTTSVLDSWEVERIMQLLDSGDSTLRKMTLAVLHKVDSNIVESLYGQLLQASSSLLGPQEQEEAIQRLLEVISLLYGTDGEDYAQHLGKIIQVVETAVSDGKPHVIQSVVEEILIKLRSATGEFRSGCVGVFSALLQAEDGKTPGPTLTVILSAVLCEYLDLSSLPPEETMRRLSLLLPGHGAAIQDVILLTMVRISANCADIPEGVLAVVGKVREQGGRHIKRRCDQFIRLCESKTALRAVMSNAKSYSLPDILLALETYDANPEITTNRPPRAEGTTSPDRPSSRASSNASHTPGKLRYKAYDAPRVTGRLRHPSSPTLSARSDGASSRFIGQDADDALSKTVTAGDLTLASGHIELRELAKTPPKTGLSLTQAMQSLKLQKEEKPQVPDLIALESPFISDPPSGSQGSSVVEEGFEAAWDRLQHANLRGWCDSPIDAVVRRLQSLQKKMRVTPADEAPFQGDLKILIPSEDPSIATHKGLAALRLREGEEDSCLWHLRCEDGNLRASIRTLLTDA